jgi:putative spermidine/putrescine transport system substrate-binding protein
MKLLTKQVKGSITLSALIAGAAGALLLPATSAAAQETVVVADAGGAQAEALAAALYEPFEKESGIKVVADHTTAIGKAQAMSRSGNVVWDVFITGDTDVALATQNDILMPIDWNVVPREGLSPEVAQTYAAPSSRYALVMTYNTNLIKDPPKSWAEWWDTTKYNCPRVMRNVPIDNLEAAVLSSGVPVDKVYPIDLKLAYEQLDKIQPKVVTFWDSGAQSIQLVADGSACLGTAWTSRVTAAEKAGQPVARVWSQAIVHQDYFTVMKGAKNPKAAMQLIAFAMRPEVQAKIASRLGTLPANPKAQDLIEPASLKYQPKPEDLSKTMLSNIRWWSTNMADAYKKYSGWLTK